MKLRYVKKDQRVYDVYNTDEHGVETYVGVVRNTGLRWECLRPNGSSLGVAKRRSVAASALVIEFK